MNKRLISALVLAPTLASLLLAASPVAAKQFDSASPKLFGSSGHDVDREKDGQPPFGKAWGFFRHEATDASDTVIVKPPVNVACVQTAIDKREIALITALDARYAAHKTALVARKDALKAAWAVTGIKERLTALKEAWKTYQTALRGTNKTFKTAKNAAWKQYRADRRACVPPVAVDADEGIDAQL